MNRVMQSERDFDFLEGDVLEMTCRDKTTLTRIVQSVTVQKNGDTWISFQKSRRGLLRKKGGTEYRLAKDGFDCGPVTVKKIS